MQRQFVTEQFRACSGWTLAEALERTADPDLWKAWVSTLPFSEDQHGFLMPAAGPDPALQDNLWQHFTTGRLVVTGVRNNGGAPVVLDAATLSAFNVPD